MFPLDSPCRVKCYEPTEQAECQTRFDADQCNSATAGVLLLGQIRPTRTIEAERFVLRGADGSVRAKLEAANDSTEFAIYNKAGKVRDQ